MSVHILHWIKEDLELKGDKLSNYSLLDLKPLMEAYNRKYNELDVVNDRFILI